MALHFSKKELKERRTRLLGLMGTKGLDGMLLFRQESMYYLTGYDTFGYVFFQCLVLTGDGRMVLLTRLPDLRQAQLTSCIQDIRIWTDGPEAQPAMDLKDLLRFLGLGKKRLGVEFDAYGLTAKNGKHVEFALAGFCELVDASLLVNQLRVVKSKKELGYVRLAAELADDALDLAHQRAGPGADEREVLADMQDTILRGGGDYPSNAFIIGSGENALLCRYFSGRGKLEKTDQLTIEWAGAYRHYHSAMMRTIPIGLIRQRQRDMHSVCVEAMAECEANLRPGKPMSKVFDAYAKTCDKAGMREHRLNATGYSLGATFSPSWMDWPMFFQGNPMSASEGMVFFLHMILMDSISGFAMCFGHTVIVRKQGCERLSRHTMELVSK